LSGGVRRARAFVVRVREKCGENGELLIDTLIGVVAKETARTADRIDAAGMLFDRGWGKPPQAVDLSVDRPSNPFEDMAAEDMAALVPLARQVQAAQRAAEARTVHELPERMSDPREPRRLGLPLLPETRRFLPSAFPRVWTLPSEAAVHVGVPLPRR
jgi:hypothetical protein